MTASWQARSTCPPSSVAVLLPLVALLALSAWRTSDAQRPPVAYQGSLRTDTRADRRAEGERTVVMGKTLRVGADTFLWQPWFATFSTRLDLSRVDTYAESDSTSDVVSGEGRVRMFPRSHFPLDAYVSVADSRTELENTLNNTGGFRRTRAGLLQRYRDADFGASYTAGYEHLVEENDDGGEVSDQLRLQMTRQIERHEFDATADIESRRRERRDESVLDGVFVARHSFRPDSEFSVESSSTLVNLDRQSPTTETVQRQALLNTSASWRPTDSKLRVNGSARSFANAVQVNGTDTLSLQASASLSATYDVSDALRASGSLGGSVSGGDGAASMTTTQTATLSYSPSSIDLAGYAYNWFATGSASNRTDADNGATPGASATVGHTVNRTLPLTEDGSWLASGSLGETFGSSVVARGGASHNVNHNASAALTRSVGSAVSTLRLTATDGRGFGSQSSVFQSLSLQGTHSSSVGRHVSWQGAFTTQVVRLETDDGSQTLPASNVSLSYRHGLLFGVRRLRFNTELSASASALQPFTGGGDIDRRVRWDNRIEYSIGRVDVRLRGTLTHRDGRQDMSVFLTVTRSFDGVF